MTVERPLWLNGLTDYTADEFRAFIDATYPSAGVLGSGYLAVTPDSPVSMNVKVATGYAVVPGKVGASRKYLLHVSAQHNVPIAAAHATLPRIDNIVAEVDDMQASDVSDAALVYAVAGTPNATPTAPVLAANQVYLATVNVDAAVATIVAGKITNKRAIVGPGSGTVTLLRHGTVSYTFTSSATSASPSVNFTPAFPAGVTPHVVVLVSAITGNTVVEASYISVTNTAFTSMARVSTGVAWSGTQTGNYIAIADVPV